MKKKWLVLILLGLGVFLFLVLSIIKSFSPNPPIYYIYKGITVTRLDEINGEAETHFFYGYYDGKSRPYPNSYIKVTYHGIDGSMSLNLVFCSDKKVEIITGYGWFEKRGTDTNIYIRQYCDSNGGLDIKLSNWLDSIKGRYQNVANLYNDTSYERSENIENYSDVKAIYNTK